MNAKMQHDLYRMHLPFFKKTMVIGTDVVNSAGKTILGLCASYTPQISQYLTKIGTHDLPRRETNDKDRISKDEKENMITERRTQLMSDFLHEALINYQKMNKGPLPEQIVIYRDGIGGPTLQQKCLEVEVKEVIDRIRGFQQGYQPKIIYCFVDRKVSHRLFYKNNGDIQNPGPGTVLDVALVEQQGDRIYDFFMIPHKATVATA